jgi:hypothetical protein
MKKYALIILTDKITVREFEFKDDFDTARQTVVSAGKKCIPLKWHHSAKIWLQPEVCE